MKPPCRFRFAFLREQLYTVSFAVLILTILVASAFQPFRTTSRGVDLVRDCVDGHFRHGARSDAELCQEVRVLVTQGACQRLAAEKGVKVVCDAAGVRLWHDTPDETRVEFDYDYLRRN